MIVRFEFHGGFKDGTAVVGHDDPRLGPDKNPAHGYLILSNGGCVGSRFRENVPWDWYIARAEKVRKAAENIGNQLQSLRESPEEVRQALKQLTKLKDDLLLPTPAHHVYEITRRDEDGTQILVQVDFVSAE